MTADYGHHEDTWPGMKIGNAIFENIKPCGRCNVITIDQQNAHINTEPLKILNQYRKVGNSVNFGTNMICTQEGVIRVGDTIKVVALIQSNVSMHGYEVVLRKDGQTISLKSKHAHNKAFEVFVEWIVPITEPSEVLIEVIANIDHETTKQTKNIAVKII